jgi:hypothetical protein
MLDPIQYEFRILYTTLADPEPEPGAGAETLIFWLWLQPKVRAPCGSGSGSTTLLEIQEKRLSAVEHNNVQLWGTITSTLKNVFSMLPNSAVVV